MLVTVIFKKEVEKSYKEPDWYDNYLQEIPKIKSFVNVVFNVEEGLLKKGNILKQNNRFLGETFIEVIEILDKAYKYHNKETGLFSDIMEGTKMSEIWELRLGDFPKVTYYNLEN